MIYSMFYSLYLLITTINININMLNSFKQPHTYSRTTTSHRMKLNAILPFMPKSAVWTALEKNAKENARQWFISRAEKRGIPWRESYDKFKSHGVTLRDIKQVIENTTIYYPPYYLKAFHGYDEGNMNWKAAYECKSATDSISANYWTEIPIETSIQWLRRNITKNIREYYAMVNRTVEPMTILDVGCSIGVSTEHMKKAYPKSQIYGLDLSPFFLSVSNFRKNSETQDITYIHENAESTSFHDDTFDLVVCNFLFHEVPREESNIIIAEIKRILKPGGVIAVVDIDPVRLKRNDALDQFRKWAFEITEPHIGEYYNTNMTTLLGNNGFSLLHSVVNDPINSIWLGQKHDIEDCTLDDCPHCTQHNDSQIIDVDVVV